mgnify:CR=1 FL=1
MKQSFKLKPSIKQLIKMLFMFIGVFILTGVVFLTANAAEPAEPESTTSVEQSDEIPSREGGGHRISDSFPPCCYHYYKLKTDKKSKKYINAVKFFIYNILAV